MNRLVLLEGLKNGTITIETKGHITNPIIDDLEDNINYELDYIKEMESGKHVDYQTKEIQTKEQCEDMINYINRKLQYDFPIGNYISEPEIYCFDCGERLRLIITSENTVSLVVPSEYRKHKEEDKGDLKYCMDVTKISDCKCADLRKAGKLVSEIDVPSGKLLFTNFFKEEKLYEFPKGMNRYDSEHSINGVAGRNNLMQYLATQNIGYGQMGNMSVNVFVNDAGDEIIIGTDYYYSEDEGETTVEHEGFTNVGSISLSVWRWMCGDVQVLKEHGEKLPRKLVVNKSVEHDYKDYILTDVKPGRWQIEHYYDFARYDDEPLVYSRLKLINNLSA